MELPLSPGAAAVAVVVVVALGLLLGVKTRVSHFYPSGASSTCVCV